MRRQVRRDRFAADLFLALDQELHIDRKLAMDGPQRLDGLNVGIELSLIVGRPASVDAAVPDHRLEGR